MAASRRLNPQAPAYIPLSYTTQTPFPNFRPLIHIYHSPFSSPPVPQPTTASQAPLLHPQSPLCTTSPATDPPPPPVVEPPPLAPSVDPQTVKFGAPSRRPRVVTLGSRGPRGTSGFSSSKRHQKVHNLGRMFNSRENKFGNSNSGDSSSRRYRYVERRTGSELKKHDVLRFSDFEENTTVMIKNIPKFYNGELLLKFLDEHCSSENQKRNENGEEEDHTVSAFDFMYLPMDFRSGYSRGYAFVNFTEARAARKFYEACNRKSWDLFQSTKIREIVCAKIQGKEALVKHLGKSKFHCESDEFLPVCFSPPRDGSGTVEGTRIGIRIASNTPNV